LKAAYCNDCGRFTSGTNTSCFAQNCRLSSIEAPLEVKGIWGICGKNYRDTGYRRKKLKGYGIFEKEIGGYSTRSLGIRDCTIKGIWNTPLPPMGLQHFAQATVAGHALPLQDEITPDEQEDHNFPLLFHYLACCNL